MKVLHFLGHNNKWNFDSYFENKIGDGFLFGSFSFDSSVFSNKTITTNKYDLQNDVLPVSFVDLQFYGKKSSKDLGKFESYDFHPANYDGKDKTDVYGPDKIIKGVKFQEENDFSKVIIPNFFNDYQISELINIINRANTKLKKKEDIEYYMTLPLSYDILKNENSVEQILALITDKKIIFDGFYIVAEPRFVFKQKLCLDYEYMENLYKVLRVLKKNDFKTILGYSNWDSIIYATLTDIDYITIGTYQNLRNFSINRFTEKVSGGNSKGAYFSSKALNFIKQEELAKFKRKNALDLIRNENNVFSDIILDEDFLWTSMHISEVQKNYLLEITKLLTKISSIELGQRRKTFTINKIKSAMELYKLIDEKEIYLETESSDYHLETWLTFLQDK